MKTLNTILAAILLVANMGIAQASDHNSKSYKLSDSGSQAKK